MQSLACCYEEGKDVEKNKEEAEKLFTEISKRALEQSRGVKWRKEGDLEWDSMRGMEDSSSKENENWRTTEKKASHPV